MSDDKTEHMSEVFAKRGRPLYGRASKSVLDGLTVDVEMAALLVAALLEARGRIPEAAALKLELGELLIRAALHKAKHPGPVALGHEMYAALHLEKTASRVSVTAKKGRRRGR